MNPLTVPCPDCAAQPCAHCLTPSGREYTKIHNARRLAANPDGPGCFVRMFIGSRTEANPGPCGQPVVRDGRCAHHEAERVRLGGAA